MLKYSLHYTGPPLLRRVIFPSLPSHCELYHGCMLWQNPFHQIPRLRHYSIYRKYSKTMKKPLQHRPVGALGSRPVACETFPGQSPRAFSYIYIYIYIYISIHIYIYIYAFMLYACVCVYIYIYIYIYSSQHLKWIKKVHHSCPKPRALFVLYIQYMQYLTINFVL